MDQPSVCIHPFRLEPPSQPNSIPPFRGQHRAPGWSPCVMQQLPRYSSQERYIHSRYMGSEGCVHTVPVRGDRSSIVGRGNRCVQGRRGIAWWAWEVSAAAMWQKYQGWDWSPIWKPRKAVCDFITLWGKDLRVLKRRFSVIIPVIITGRE